MGWPKRLTQKSIGLGLVSDGLGLVYDGWTSRLHQIDGGTYKR